MRVLVTGAAGFIGSHTMVELLAAGHDVVAVDNFANAGRDVFRRVAELAGRDFFRRECDVRDAAALEAVLEEAGPVDACIHFAGLKAVGESVAEPLRYYGHNIGATLALLSVLPRHGCKRVVFSSSATVYGDAPSPVSEETPRGICTNPYGWTKWMQERMLEDLAAADARSGAADPWRVVLLRYFNPVGAHPSGLIGEDPRGTPNNLMPYLVRVASGRLPVLRIFGNDYPTPDGTGVRDYIHVCDLARGHVAALRALAESPGGVQTYNLGSGRGASVLELLHAFEEANGVPVKHEFVPRRPGDIAVSFADCSKAERELGWHAQFGLAEICRDAWRREKLES